MQHLAISIDILAFGMRTVDDKSVVFGTLDSLADRRSNPVRRLLSGGAAGADSLAEEWAVKRGIPCMSKPAQWNNQDGSFRKSAGIERTKEIVESLDPNRTLCVAFLDLRYPGASAIRVQGGLGAMLMDKGRGTRFTISECLRRGFDVMVVWRFGDITWVKPGPGPQPPGWYPPSAGQRLDASDDSGRDLGEEGWSQQASDAEVVAKYKARERDPRLPKNQLGDDRNDIARKNGNPQAGEGFRDFEKGSAVSLDRTPFIPGGTAIICEQCSEAFHGVDGDRFCSACEERFDESETERLRIEQYGA